MSTRPKGLTAKEDYLLWGLMAISLSQPEPARELWVTPDYVMKRLGFDSRQKRGGYRYSDWFKGGLDRLAYVIYDASAFYIPDLREYRPVIMGLLKRHLPADLDASRQWQIRWDDTFFDLCVHDSGGLFFDLQTFMELTPATRRLFLLLLKIFNNGRKSPWFDVRRLAVDQLGYSPDLPLKKLKQNVANCTSELCERGIVELPSGIKAVADAFRHDRVGVFSIQFAAGSYFRSDRRDAAKSATNISESPQYDPLKAIGFNDAEIGRILRENKASHVAKAADITQRAMQGGKDVPKIRKHPKAFFRDYVAGFGNRSRTAPDWYVASEKRDKARQATEGLRAASDSYQDAYNAAFEEFLHEQRQSDRFNQIKQVLIASYLRDMSRQTAEQQADKDTRMRLQQDFEFPDESVWLQRHYVSNREQINDAA